MDVHSFKARLLLFSYSAFGAQIVLRDRSNSAEGRPNALMTETPDYFMKPTHRPLSQ